MMDETTAQCAPSTPATVNMADAAVENDELVSDVAGGVRSPCFAAGTRIDTSHGAVAVEDLRIGDLVYTLDDMYEPVCGNIGFRVAGTGALRPVMIPAGMFGDHGALQVSPQHRLSVLGLRAGHCHLGSEVPVAAADLVRAGLLRRAPVSEWAQYNRLAFEAKVIISAEGLWSESGPSNALVHETGMQRMRLAPAFNLLGDHDRFADATRDPWAIRTRVA